MAIVLSQEVLGWFVLSQNITVGMITEKHQGPRPRDSVVSDSMVWREDAGLEPQQAWVIASLFSFLLCGPGQVI